MIYYILRNDFDPRIWFGEGRDIPLPSRPALEPNQPSIE